MTKYIADVEGIDLAWLPEAGCWVAVEHSTNPGDKIKTHNSRTSARVALNGEWHEWPPSPKPDIGTGNEWPFIPLSVREMLASWDITNPDPQTAVRLADWCHYWHGPGSRARWAEDRAELRPPANPVKPP